MPSPDMNNLNHLPTQYSSANLSSSTADDLALEAIPLVDLSRQYDLLERLGQGGMGTVTRARLKGLSRCVAIKRMKAEYRGLVSYQLRFIEEAKAVSALRHRNILQIENWGRDDEGPFLVLEYINGEDLAARVERKGPLTADDVQDIACAVCDGLQHAHNHGIIHRDIKPHNILIAANGDVKLTDFGLVRQIESDLHLSKSGQILGSLPYMAPEQRDDPRKADRRSDVWSLGATMYHLLVGQIPPVSMLFEFDRVPESLRLPLRRALSLYSAERWPSAGDFSDALRQAILPQQSASAVPGITVPAATDRQDGECRRCQVVNPEDRLYCKKCGGNLQEPCLQCGVSIGVWEHWCPKCGLNLDQHFSQQCERIQAAKQDYHDHLAQQDFAAARTLIHRVSTQFSHVRYRDQLNWANGAEEQIQQLEASAHHARQIAVLETQIAAAIRETDVRQLDISLQQLTDLCPDHGDIAFAQNELSRIVREHHLRVKQIAEQSRDYAAAAALLDSIPQPLQIERLASEVYRRRDRVIELEGQIQQCEESRNWQEMMESAAALQKLQPKRIDVVQWISKAERERQEATNRRLLVAPFDADQAAAAQAAWAKFLGIEVEVTNNLGMKFRVIPPGIFQMGSPESEVSRCSDEQQHKVRINHPKLLGVYPVTQGEWTKLMGSNPSHFAAVKGEDTSRFPVENVNWDDCKEFLQRLNLQHPMPRWVYRLPTEAEWEYACRAGTVTPFWFGSQLNGEHGNCDGNHPYPDNTAKGPYLKRPCVVGNYGANPFGIYDQHGNVWEWCRDWYGAYGTLDADDPSGPSSGSSRVLRGGAWINRARRCDSADRSYSDPSVRYYGIGFRVLCEWIAGF